MGDAASADKFISEAPFPLTEVDKWVLSQTDEEFKKHDWKELKEIIGEFRSPITCWLEFHTHTIILLYSAYTDAEAQKQTNYMSSNASLQIFGGT